jgi:mannosyltransferase
LLVFGAIIALLPARGRQASPAESTRAERGAATMTTAPWWRQHGVSLASVGLPLLVVPAFVLIVESIVGKTLYVDRYVLYGECGAALLAGAGLYRIGGWLLSVTGRSGWRWLAWAPGVLAGVAVLLAQIGPQQNIRVPGSRHYNFTLPAAFIGAHARPNDGVLFFDTFFRHKLLYPSDFKNTDDFGQALSPVQDGTFRGTDKPFATVRPLNLERRRIWVVGLPPSPSLQTSLLRQQSQVLLRFFTLVGQRASAAST